ncbi:MAG: BsuPI-related putative proteinase inhibitor [Mycobacteriales bacterium]
MTDVATFGFGDFGDGLPRAPFRPLAPAAGGFDSAYAEGRRRKRRRGIGTSALSGALAVALVTSGALDGIHAPVRLGIDGPSVTNQPGLDRNGRGDGDVATGDADLPMTALGPATAAGDKAAARLAPPGVRAPHAPSDPGSARGNDPYSSSKNRTTKKWPATATMTTNYEPTCGLLTGGRSVGSGWCLRVSSSSQGADWSDLRLQACREYGESASIMSFPTSQEVDFTIRKGKQTLWTWSRGQRFDDTPQVVTVGEMSCAQWSVRWDQVDEQGRRLKSGVYDLTGFSLADELGPGATYETPITF